MIRHIAKAIDAICELPNALHSCVEMAHEAASLRKLGAFDIMNGAQLYEANNKIARLESQLRERIMKDSQLIREIDSLLDVERFISNERWAWARERIEALESELKSKTEAAFALGATLDRELDARRPRMQLDEPCPLTGAARVLYSDNGVEWFGCDADSLPTMRDVLWRYLSPEDMP